MSVVSGKFGVVNGISTVRNWSINETSTPQKFVASNTSGGAGRKHGVKDFNGSFSGYGFAPVVKAGDSFTFAGYTGTTTWEGDAIVDSVVITYSWVNAEIISWVVNFSGNGALTSTLEAAPFTDATDPEVPQTCGSYVQLDGGPAVKLENLTGLTLTLTCENQSYVNSNTIIDDQCWTMRKRGNFDWTMSINQQDDAGLGDFAVGKDLLLYISDSDATEPHWTLKWAHVEGMSNLQADIETGAIISRTLNFAMNGFNPSVGFVLQEDTDYWPFS